MDRTVERTAEEGRMGGMGWGGFFEIFWWTRLSSEMLHSTPVLKNMVTPASAPTHF